MSSAALWQLLTSPRGKQPEFPVHCIGTRKFSNLIESDICLVSVLLHNLWQPSQLEHIPTAAKVSCVPHGSLCLCPASYQCMKRERDWCRFLADPTVYGLLIDFFFFFFF